MVSGSTSGEFCWSSWHPLLPWMNQRKNSTTNNLPLLSYRILTGTANNTTIYIILRWGQMRYKAATCRYSRRYFWCMTQLWFTVNNLFEGWLWEVILVLFLLSCKLPLNTVHLSFWWTFLDWRQKVILCTVCIIIIIFCCLTKKINNENKHKDNKYDLDEETLLTALPLWEAISHRDWCLQHGICR